MRALARTLTRRVLRAYRRIRNRRPAVGRVEFGGLRRTTPVSRAFGFDRGQPVDRFYIERFLAEHAADVRGRVLEIGDNAYTVRFGGTKVLHSDVLTADASSPGATLVGDLTRSDGLPVAVYDCIIVTQTLQFIYDVHAAVRTLERLLKPGGVVLATLPGISQISRYDMDRWGEYWRFTSRSARRVFEEVFPAEAVVVRAYGNVLAATGFLHGVAAEELNEGELLVVDPDYELVICVRAEKSGGPA
ncbi:MAG: methyltransferase domain-containing protein [Armatimonadota bacterium]|nr:methyltransferase domain-containing protein [Armatimonadota bacterium]